MIPAIYHISESDPDSANPCIMMAKLIAGNDSLAGPLLHRQSRVNQFSLDIALE
jgi:hypothetical protein